MDWMAAVGGVLARLEGHGNVIVKDMFFLSSFGGGSWRMPGLCSIEMPASTALSYSILISGVVLTDDPLF